MNMHTPVARSPGSANRLLGRWVRWTVAGEMVGFVAPAVLGVVSAEWSPRTAIPTMVAAGAVEGLMLGAAHALTQACPRRKAWRALESARDGGQSAGSVAVQAI